MSTNPIALNTHVLDALGIEWKGQNIAHVSVDLKGPDTYPIATITRYLSRQTLATHRSTWVLTSAEPIGFDIDAACEAARRVVRRTVDNAFNQAVTDIAAGFIYSRQRLGLPITLAHLELADWPGGSNNWLHFVTLGGNEFYVYRGAA